MTMSAASAPATQGLHEPVVQLLVDGRETCPEAFFSG